MPDTAEDRASTASISLLRTRLSSRLVMIGCYCDLSPPARVSKQRKRCGSGSRSSQKWICQNSDSKQPTSFQQSLLLFPAGCLSHAICFIVSKSASAVRLPKSQPRRVIQRSATSFQTLHANEHCICRSHHPHDLFKNAPTNTSHSLNTTDKTGHQASQSSSSQIVG